MKNVCKDWRGTRQERKRKRLQSKVNQAEEHTPVNRWFL